MHPHHMYLWPKKNRITVVFACSLHYLAYFACSTHFLSPLSPLACTPVHLLDSGNTRTKSQLTQTDLVNKNFRKT